MNKWIKTPINRRWDTDTCPQSERDRDIRRVKSLSLKLSTSKKPYILMTQRHLNLSPKVLLFFFFFVCFFNSQLSVSSPSLLHWSEVIKSSSACRAATLRTNLESSEVMWGEAVRRAQTTHYTWSGSLRRFRPNWPVFCRLPVSVQIPENKYAPPQPTTTGTNPNKLWSSNTLTSVPLSYHLNTEAAFLHQTEPNSHLCPEEVWKLCRDASH